MQSPIAVLSALLTLTAPIHPLTHRVTPDSPKNARPPTLALTVAPALQPLSLPPPYQVARKKKLDDQAVTTEGEKDFPPSELGKARS